MLEFEQQLVDETHSITVDKTTASIARDSRDRP